MGCFSAASMSRYSPRDLTRPERPSFELVGHQACQQLLFMLCNQAAQTRRPSKMGPQGFDVADHMVDDCVVTLKHSLGGNVMRSSLFASSAGSAIRASPLLMSWFTRTTRRMCDPKRLATRPVRARGSVTYWNGFAAGHNERTALPLRRKFGAALFHLIKRLALGYEQPHTLGTGPDGPAIIGVLDDESRCCRLLSHTQD